MGKTKIVHVVGTRPNFMKVAPILRAMKSHLDRFENLLVHTGQHYDEKMSKIFFEELELPRPDRYLGVGSGTHAQQTAKVMVEFEKVLKETSPDLALVVGDVNSTVACSLAAAKLNIPVAHVEAGLRSFDRTMPEEINRIITDQIADYLFTTELSANTNLRNDGITADKIHFVGNVMIDSLIHLFPKAKLRWEVLSEKFHLSDSSGNAEPYILVTLHRPSNVDNPDSLKQIIDAFHELSKENIILFPVHPRTRKRILSIDSKLRNGNLQYLDPIGYLDFLCLMNNASLVLTDSGGIQEETTFLKRPCYTLRPNTERPITLTQGTNRLLETKTDAILRTVQNRLPQKQAKSKIPDLWDGKAAIRIIQVLLKRTELPMYTLKRGQV